MTHADIVRRMLLGQGTLNVDDAGGIAQSNGNSAPQDD
jgi:hypothetical protein